MWLKVLYVVCIVFIVQACGKVFHPEKACNFVQNSRIQRVSWKNETPVTINIDSSVPEIYYEAILSAMERWEQAMQRDLFKFGGVVSGGQNALKDGASIIYWLENWGSGEQCLSSNTSKVACEQARTTIYWMGEQIYEADIMVNASATSNFTYSASEEAKGGEVDFESLMVHELGHVLGLSHNDIDVESVMARTLPNGLLRREPSEEDLDSLHCEY